MDTRWQAARVYIRQGRVSAITVSSGFTTAYAGSYTFTDDKVIHHIEVSAIPNLTNTDQVRFVTIQGNRLTLRGAVTVGGVTFANGEVVWERLKPETNGK